MSARRDNTRSVRVELGARSYDVRIAPGLLASLAGTLADALGRTPRQAFLAIDSGAAAHGARAAASLRAAGVHVSQATLHASEPEKSLASLTTLLTAMARARLERAEPVVAVGGGIIGDLAGFAAACYRRGVPILQCPTTLLSMVDASVGGKTGVNLDAGPEHGELLKNMVGAFHQPLGVVADTESLRTLPDRDLRSGLAECVKHAMLGAHADDPGHAAWLEGALPRILARDDNALAELIARSVATKARIVAGDEREESEAATSRALLNLGHTFAHAIETIPHLSPTTNPDDAPLRHGEAVALGLVAASRAAHAAGLCGLDTPNFVAQVLGAIPLPTRVRGLPDNDHLFTLMGSDKKVSTGRLRLVLPTGAWSARVVTSPDARIVHAAWDAIRG